MVEIKEDKRRKGSKLNPPNVYKKVVQVIILIKEKVNKF